MKKNNINEPWNSDITEKATRLMKVLAENFEIAKSELTTMIMLVMLNMQLIDAKDVEKFKIFLSNFYDDHC